MKFKMNDVEFEIIEVQQKEYKQLRVEEDEKEDGCTPSNTDTGVYLGATHHKTCKIYLDKNQPKDRKRKTLLHELMHCYVYEYISHTELQFNEEELADISANSHDIIHKIVEDYFNQPVTITCDLSSGNITCLKNVNLIDKEENKC